MLDKVKAYWQYLVDALLLIMTGAFLYEKSRANTNEAIVDNQKTIDQVNKLNQQIAGNQAQLTVEESKREEDKKEAADAKSDDDTDPTSFLSKR